MFFLLLQLLSFKYLLLLLQLKLQKCLLLQLSCNSNFVVATLSFYCCNAFLLLQVTHIRGEAEVQRTEEDSQRLVGAARQLADATTRMIEAAKTCAVSPDEATHQVALKATVEDLRTATGIAAQEQLRRRAMLRLEQAAKQTAASATQTIAAAHACEASNKNPQSHEHLARQCKDVSCRSYFGFFNGGPFQILI